MVYGSTGQMAVASRQSEDNYPGINLVRPLWDSQYGYIVDSRQRSIEKSTERHCICILLAELQVAIVVLRLSHTYYVEARSSELSEGLCTAGMERDGSLR